jgi:hypothetical protein|tara:strand:+ start:545 stop:673 length:129 start_codon:yes stop_codon:yes gene_type:complete
MAIKYKDKDNNHGNKGYFISMSTGINIENKLTGGRKSKKIGC